LKFQFTLLTPPPKKYELKSNISKYFTFKTKYFESTGCDGFTNTSCFFCTVTDQKEELETSAKERRIVI